MPNEGSIEQFDHQLAEKLLARVSNLLDQTRAAQDELHRNYVEIGIAILDVQKAKAWMILPDLKSFDQYIMSCEDKFGRKRTALYEYTRVARELLPEIGETQLIEIGISKAGQLASYLHSGQKLTPELLLAAKDQKVDDFRSDLFRKMNKIPENGGKWFKIEFVASKEELEELEQTFELSEEVEPSPEGTPEWAKIKTAVFRMAAEFKAEYGPRASGGAYLR